MAMVRSSLKGMWNLSYEGGTYLYTHLKMGASSMFQTWQRGLMSLLVLASLPFLAPLIFVVMMVGGIFLVPFFCGVLAYYALFHPASLSNIKWFRSPKYVPSPEPRPTELVMENLDFDGVGNSNRGDMLGFSNLDQEGIAQESEPKSEDNKAIALIAPESMQDDEVAFSGVSVREASMKDIKTELQQKGSVVDISFETPLVVESNQQLGGYEDAQGEELILGRNERGQEREDSTFSASSYSEAVKGDSTHEIEPVDTAPDNSLPFEETLGNEAILEEVNKDVAGLSNAGRVPEQEGSALGVPSIKKLAVDEETVEYKDVVLPGRDEKAQQEENRPSDSLLSEKLVEAKSPLKEIGEHSTGDSYPVVENQDLKSEEAEYNAFHLNDQERDRGEDPSMILESPDKIFLEARVGSGDEFGAKPVEVSKTKFGEEKEAGPVVDSSAPTTEQRSLPVESVPVKLASPVKDVALIEEAAPVQEAEAGAVSVDELGAKPVEVSRTDIGEEKEAGPVVDSSAPTTEQRSLPVESESVKLASPVEDVAAIEEAAPVEEAEAGDKFGDEYGAKPVEVLETKFGEDKEAGSVVDSSAPTTEQRSLPVESEPVMLASAAQDILAIAEAAPVEEAEAGAVSVDEFGAKPVEVSRTDIGEEKEAGPVVDSSAPTTEQRSLPVESESVKLASPVEDVAAIEEAAPVLEAEAGAGSVDEVGAEPVEVSGAKLGDEKESGSVVDSSAQTTEQGSLPVESESVKLASPIKDVAAIEEAVPMEEAESTEVGTTEAQSASEDSKALGEPEHLVGSEAVEEKEDDHLVDRKQEHFDGYKVESKELGQAVSVSTQPLLSEAYLEHLEDELPSEKADQLVDDTTAVEGESEPNYESADESFSHSDYEQEQVDVIQTNARKLNDGTGNALEDDTELYLKGVGGKQDVPVDEVDAPVVQEVDLHGSQLPLEEVAGVEADAVAAPAFDPAAPVTEEKPLLVEDVAPLAGVASVGVGAFVEDGIANKTPQPAPQVTEQKLDTPAPVPEVLKKVEAPAIKDASMLAREVTKKSDADPFAKQVVTEDEALTVKKETEVPLVVSEPVSEEKHVPLVEEDVSALSVEPEVSRMEQRSLPVESEPVKLASPVQDVPAIAEAAPVEEAEAGAGSVDEFGAKPVEVSEAQLGEEKEAGPVVDSSAPTTEQRSLPVESEPVKLASAAQDVPGIAEAAPLEDAGAGAGSVDEYGAKPLEVSEAQLGEEKGEAGPVVDSSAPTTEQRSLPVESESVKLASSVADVPAIEEAAPLEEAESAAALGDEFGAKPVEVSEAALCEEKDEGGPVVDSSAPTMEQRSLPVESEPVKLVSTVEDVPAIEEAAEAAPLEEADSAVEAGDELGTKPVEVAGTKFSEEKEAGSVVDSSAPTTEQRSLPVESESVKLASPVVDVPAIAEAAPLEEAEAGAGSIDELGAKPEVSEAQFGTEEEGGPVVDSSAPTVEQRSLPVESEPVKLASAVQDVPAIEEAAPVQEAESAAYSGDEFGAKRVDVSGAQLGDEKEEGGPVVDSSAPTTDQRSLPVELEEVKLASAAADVPVVEEAAPVQEAEAAAKSGDEPGAKDVEVSEAALGEEKEEVGTVVDSSAPTTDQRSLPVESESVKLASPVEDVAAIEEAAPVQEAEAAAKSGDELGRKLVEVSETELGEEDGEAGPVVDSLAPTTEQRSLPVDSEPVQLAPPVADVPAIAEAAPVQEVVAGAGSVGEHGAKPEVSEAQFGKEEEGGPVVDSSAVEEAAHAQEAESAAELGDEFGAKAVEVSETEFGDEKGEAGSVVDSSAPTTEQRSLPVDSEPVKLASAVQDVPAIEEDAAVEEAGAGAGSLNEFGAKAVDVSGTQLGEEKEVGTLVDSSAPTTDQQSLPVESEPMKFASAVADVPAILEGASLSDGVSVEDAALVEESYAKKGEEWESLVLKGREVEAFIKKAGAPGADAIIAEPDEVRGDVTEPSEWISRVADLPSNEEAAPLKVSVSAEEALSEKDAVTPVVEEKELITPVAAVEMMDVDEMPMVVPPAQEGADSEAEAPVVEERKLDAHVAAGSIGEDKVGETSEAPVTEPEVTKDVAAEEAPDMREVELSLAESESALEEQEAPEVESLAVPDLEPEVPVVAEKSLPVQELQVEATPVEESPPLNVDDSMAVNENLNQALKDRSVKVSDRELENASNIAQLGEQGHGVAQKLEEYSEKDKVLESHTGQDVFPTLKPLNVVQSKDSSHDEQVDGSDSVLTRPPTQRRISFEDADEEVNMGAPSSASRRTGAEGTNSNFVFKSHLGRDHRTHRHSAPDFLGTQTWVREAPFYSPQSSSRGHKKAKYKKWSESDGGRPARTLSAPFSDSTGVHMGEFETLLQSWQERDKATHSPTRLSPSSSPISPAEIGRQIREEINTIQKIIGQDIPPQYSLWKEVETLCQIVGMQLPYMGDVSDLTKARNGLDLLKVVVGIK